MICTIIINYQTNNNISLASYFLTMNSSLLLLLMSIKNKKNNLLRILSIRAEEEKLGDLKQ